jgi:hypothetical protein
MGLTGWKMVGKIKVMTKLSRISVEPVNSK